MKSPRLILILILLATSAMLLAQTGASAQAPSRKSCSAKGLHFSYKRAGVTFSVKVVRLKVTRVSCLRARTVATRVARRLLHNRKVPARVAGFSVHVTQPCPGCAPDTLVTAKKPKRNISFHVLGGA